MEKIEIVEEEFCAWPNEACMSPKITPEVKTVRHLFSGGTCARWHVSEKFSVEEIFHPINRRFAGYAISDDDGWLWKLIDWSSLREEPEESLTLYFPPEACSGKEGQSLAVASVDAALKCIFSC